jgi:hypothetical protein
VVLAPAHARQLREARQAQRRLNVDAIASDIVVAAPNLPAYDQLVGR